MYLPDQYLSTYIGIVENENEISWKEKVFEIENKKKKRTRKKIAEKVNGENQNKKKK